MELEMINTAPDVGALMMYDFYSSPPALASEDANTTTVEDEDQEQYSIIAELFSSLSTALT